VSVRLLTLRSNVMLERMSIMQTLIDWLCYQYIIAAPRWAWSNWCLERAGRWGFSDHISNAPHEPRRDSGVALDGVVGSLEDR